MSRPRAHPVCCRRTCWRERVRARTRQMALWSVRESELSTQLLKASVIFGAGEQGEGMASF